MSSRLGFRLNLEKLAKRTLMFEALVFALTFSPADKPRSAIVAEILAEGYTLSDSVVQKAIEADKREPGLPVFSLGMGDLGMYKRPS